MDVAVDTNILLADPWLESQKSRALLDFLDKTRSRLIVHAVVADEFRAVLERNWMGALGEMENAARKATRQGLEPPAVDREAVLAAARARLEKAWKSTRWIRTDVKLNNELLPEALRRSINRIAPCARTGEEIRDALVWLGLIEHCANRKVREMAFISSNSRDFCGPEAGTLAPTLQADVAERKVRLAYYSSLDDFLRDHAAPIAHFTVEWVEERLDGVGVEKMITRYLEYRDPELFRLSWHYEEWRPAGYPRIHTVAADLTEIYVWEYSSDETNLFLSFSVRVDGEIRCEREEGDPERGYYTLTEYLPASAELTIEISAEVKGDELELIEVESVDRL